MNQTSPNRFVLILLILISSQVTAAADFQLKGVSLGTSATTVCGSSKITDNFDDIVRKYKADIPSLIDMDTKECEVEYESFGGNRLAEPARLLFLNDSLILFKLKLVGLPLSNFVDIYKALIEDYGKPQRAKSGRFVTDTWKRKGETLILERLGREWDDNDVTIILRQDTGYRTFQSRHKANSAVLERLDADKTKKDMR